MKADGVQRPAQRQLARVGSREHFARRHAPDEVIPQIEAQVQRRQPFGVATRTEARGNVDDTGAVLKRLYPDDIVSVST